MCALRPSDAVPLWPPLDGNRINQRKRIEEALALTNRAVVTALDGLRRKGALLGIGRASRKIRHLRLLPQKRIDPEPIVGKIKADVHDCDQCDTCSNH
jgi:hypothetical protein